MFSVIELNELGRRHPGAQFAVHDGYDGWSYGVPKNPIPITLETACELLNILSQKCPENELRRELEDEPAIIGQVEYAEEGGPLYHATLKNRFLAFYPVKDATFEKLIPRDFLLPNGEAI